MKMIEISPDKISIADGQYVRVVTIDETLEGRYKCILAYIPASLKDFGLCKVFSINDIFTNELKQFNVEQVKKFFVLERE